jgi:hypothetical protein
MYIYTIRKEEVQRRDDAESSPKKMKDPAISHEL